MQEDPGNMTSVPLQSLHSSLFSQDIDRSAQLHTPKSSSVSSRPQGSDRADKSLQTDFPHWTQFPDLSNKQELLRHQSPGKRLALQSLPPSDDHMIEMVRPCVLGDLDSYVAGINTEETLLQQLPDLLDFAESNLDSDQSPRQSGVLLPLVSGGVMIAHGARDGLPLIMRNKLFVKRMGKHLAVRCIQTTSAATLVSRTAAKQSNLQRNKTEQLYRIPQKKKNATMTQTNEKKLFRTDFRPAKTSPLQIHRKQASQPPGRREAPPQISPSKGSRMLADMHSLKSGKSSASSSLLFSPKLVTVNLLDVASQETDSDDFSLFSSEPEVPSVAPIPYSKDGFDYPPLVTMNFDRKGNTSSSGFNLVSRYRKTDDPLPIQQEDEEHMSVIIKAEDSEERESEVKRTVPRPETKPISYSAQSFDMVKARLERLEKKQDQGN